MAGHSLGEYSALVCAGVIQFNDAVKIVAARGEYMQQAVAAGVGAMAAIVGLTAEKVKNVCEQSAGQDIVAAVNFNSPEQIVIAGHAAAVDRACALAKTEGAKLAMLLPVSVPAHCELMRPAAERLSAKLKAAEFNSPSIPVINNVDVAALTVSEEIREALVKQLFSPVRWVETIQAMAAEGVDTVIECGPGRVLSGLIKRIDSKLVCYTTNDVKSLQETLGKFS
jgi:[acyl-carrier-protein] S-malonyltransferase